MKLGSTIRFADESIKEAFYKLEKGDSEEKELFKAINQSLNKIEKNAFCGTQVPKDRIPNAYISLFNVKNLWKLDLPKGWRLIYSVTTDGIIVISLILEWFNHKKYSERFGYNKK